MKQKSALKLRSNVDFICLDLVELLLRLLHDQSVTIFSVVCIENRELTKTDVEDNMWIEDFERAIQSGGKNCTRRLNGEQDGPSLLSCLKDMRKILLVRLGDKLHHVNDKNNYRLIKSKLESKLKETKTYTRTVDGLFNRLERNASYYLDLCLTTQKVKASDNVMGKGETAQTKTRADKALPPTEQVAIETIPQRKRVKSIPAEPLDQDEEICLPFYKTEYKNDLRRDGANGPMHSIQATDGACSILPKSSFVSSIGQQYKSIIQSKPGSNLSTRNGFYTRASHRQARYPDMEDPERRRGSYFQTNWESHPDRPDVETLIENGFFCTGIADLVRCFQCGIGLKDWSPDDVVIDEHIRHSSACSYLAEKLGPEQLNQLKSRILCGTDSDSGLGYAGAALSQVPTAARSNSSSLLNSQLAIGSAQTSTTNRNKNASPELKYPIRHSDYQSVETRLASFVKFPVSAQQNHRRLATAGFFYTGTRDICRCFCCDGGMQHWVAEDDPVQEHAKHFPTCAYIRQLKGDEYIKRVRIEAGMEPLEVNAQGSSSSTATQSYITSQVAALALNTNQGTPSGNSDVSRSTVLKNVLASGFEKDKVMKAVDILVKRGMGTFKEDDIVNTILDTPDEIESIQLSASLNEPETLRQENARLKSFVECMLCQTGETNILFLPCAHHKVCAKCSENLEECPVCQKQILQKVRTYMS